VLEGERLASRVILPALYEQAAFRPLWREPDAVHELFAALDTIDEEGLNPRDYHMPVLARLRKRLRHRPDAKTRAHFDLLLTDALLRLTYHLHFGRADPAAIDRDWNIELTVDKADYIARHARAIRLARIDDLLQDMAPTTPYYFSLIRAYRIYKAIQAKEGWPHIPAGPTLRHGMQSGRIIALRHRLAATRDILSGNLESPRFDDEVEVGLRRFQQRHGLDPTGIMDRPTLKALNIPVGTRINQIRANLERARWVLPVLPERFVLVDIAGFSLSYYHDGAEVWKTRVQVGKAYRKTPVFRSSIRYLVLNPTWTIPPTILHKDILPIVARNSSYLKQRHIEVVDRQGRRIDAATVDWARYLHQPFPYALRRQAGPGNPLGRIKFVFPNRHAVYLHDTPHTSIFHHKIRTSSSGCVRVQHPYRLAALLLDDSAHWGEQQIRQAIASGKTRWLKLTRPVPIIIMYWTVRMDSHDTVHFREDIYGRDRAIVAALKRPFRFRRHTVLKTVN